MAAGAALRPDAACAPRARVEESTNLGCARAGGRGRRSAPCACAAIRLAASVAASIVLVAGGSRVSGGAAPSELAAAPTGERTEPARRSVPVTDVLGIRIGMPEADAHRRLARLGVRNEEHGEVEHEGGGEAMGRELWTLSRSDFRYVLLGVDREGRIASLQAFARPGGRKIRYRDLGNLEQARRLGFYIYEWQVPGKDGGRGLRIEARGSDPEYIGSYMIVRERPPAARSAAEQGGNPAGAPSELGR